MTVVTLNVPPDHTPEEEEALVARVAAAYAAVPDGDDVLVQCRLVGRRTVASQDEPLETVHFAGSVRMRSASAVATSPGLAEAVLRAEEALGETGRVLLRPSGTEPVVRVMVEAPTDAQAAVVAEELAAVVAREIPLP